MLNTDALYEGILKRYNEKNLPMKVLETLKAFVVEKAKEIDAISDEMKRKDLAIKFLNSISEHVHNMYQAIIHNSNDSKKNKAMLQEMQFYQAPPEGLLANMSCGMLNSFNTLSKKFPIEETYLELKRLIKDNGSPLIQSSFSKKENDLYFFIIEKIVQPNCDESFKKIKKFFSIKKRDGGLSHYVFDLYLSDLTEYKEIHKTLSKYAQLQNNDIKNSRDFDNAWFMENIENSPDLLNMQILLGMKVRIFTVLIEQLDKFIIDDKRKYKIAGVADILPPCQGIMLLHESLPEMNDSINYLASTLQARQKFLKSCHDEDKQSDKKDKKEISKPSESKFEKPIEITPHLDSSASKSESIEHPPLPSGSALLYSYQSKQTVAEDRVSSSTKKIVDAIYDLSNKVKYSKLVTFIENTLHGNVHSKTGSSSRKLRFASGETVFMHEGHGKDRAQYVPPATIKAVKLVLERLGISPDNYNMPIPHQNAKFTCRGSCYKM